MSQVTSILRYEQASPEDRESRDEVALRGFFRLALLWGLTMEEARVLLGRPSRARLYSWKAGRVRGLPHDTLQRISYLLGIHKALQILYSDQGLADTWVRRPNTAFGGQSALERMLAGDVSDLAAVRAHLDAARGGWT
jgi:Antitoxin Xre/MbcA/ParS C-terminal toxin-binding domain/Antitoxin Xre-like helix-turn-helix domain